MAKKSKLVIIILSIFLWNCANQIPPGGGPIDTTPPQIIEVFPSNGTTNFNKNFFEITFSEYVDKRTVRDAIFISPPLKHPLEYDWSGRTLRVYFQDTLKENTTYTVSIGAVIEDLNNRNKMIEPFSFAFSTGEKIDIGKISGKIYDKDPAGTLVFAYKKNDNTFNPAIQLPDYISQVGKNGKYNLVGLSNGEYYLLAVKDQLRDFLYQKNIDKYGVQFKKVVLIDDVNEINEVNFFLTIEDTIPPSISNVSMKDLNHLLIEFSEAIDSTKITVNNFYLIDSSINKKIIPEYFYKGDAKDNYFYLAFVDTLSLSNKTFLIAENIYDKNGIMKNEEVNFSIKNVRDTIAPRIIKIAGQYPGDKIDFDNPVLTIKFDDGIDIDSLRSAIKIYDAKQNIFPFEIGKIDDATFNVNIKSKLKQRSEYNLDINLSKLTDVCGNKVDSIYKYKFTTVSELDFSGVSGFVEYENEENEIIVVLEDSENSVNLYKQKVDDTKKFNFNKVLPGKYLLWSFVDKNKDGKYTFGKVNLFSYSEEFKFYPDTLNLRARWPVGDIVIK
ncbi:Ig-like domain-containing protein [Rosettibacter firmus]|uniref:Ig-like domain-containing protein n=1 Tax=Rosettibacter firmus TaxID=3111522 RepID=UPI00336BBFF0